MKPLEARVSLGWLGEHRSRASSPGTPGQIANPRAESGSIGRARPRIDGRLLTRCLLDLEARPDLVGTDTDQGAWRVRAARVPEEHRNPLIGRAREPAEHPARHRLLVADVAGDDHVNVGRRGVQRVRTADGNPRVVRRRVQARRGHGEWVDVDGHDARRAKAGRDDRAHARSGANVEHAAILDEFRMRTQVRRDRQATGPSKRPVRQRRIVHAQFAGGETPQRGDIVGLVQLDPGQVGQWSESRMAADEGTAPAQREGAHARRVAPGTARA